MVTTTSRPTPDPNIELVTVFRTSDWGMAAIVTSLLEDAGIEYALRGDALRSFMGGWGGFNSALGDAEFQVREADAPEAARLLARLAEPQTDPGPD